MPQTNDGKGAGMRLTYYDDFTRSYRLKPPYALALWIIGAGLVVSWIVAVW